jgi:hypothetical protein
MFRSICRAFWISEPYESVSGQLTTWRSSPIPVSNSMRHFDRAGIHFCELSHRRDPLPPSRICDFFGHRSLRTESEECPETFIGKSRETNRELFGLLKSVKLEYRSNDRTERLFELCSVDLEEMNDSIDEERRTGSCARRVHCTADEGTCANLQLADAEGYVQGRLEHVRAR